MADRFLTEFEIYVLSAVTRLEGNAYGMTILREIETRTGRQIAVGVVYAALGRLEDKGLVATTIGAPTPVQGGRARRYVQLTKAGRQALSHSAAMLARMIPSSVLAGDRK
jgi:DNA-binding PadR family transcriptional regulator